MAENPNPYYPIPTNVLLEVVHVHTCQFHADGMPMLTPVGQKNRRENDLELGDVNSSATKVRRGQFRDL